MKNNLLDVITAIDLSKKTFARIKLNYLWAIIYNLLGTINCAAFLLKVTLTWGGLLLLLLTKGIPLAAGVFYPLGIVIPTLVAGLAMAFSSVSVVISSLLLKRYKRPAVTVTLEEIETHHPNGSTNNLTNKKPLLQDYD